MTYSIRLAPIAVFAAVLLWAGAALAHLTGQPLPEGAFLAGFSHPPGGFDHVLAMGAVGVLALQRGGGRLWLLPAAFIAAMILGFAVASAGIGLPWVELGIAGSLVALGLAIVLDRRIPLWACAGLIALCAVLHGHAHGTEAVNLTDPAVYAGGFALATALLHGAGIGFGIVLRQLRLMPAAGYGVAAIGAVIAAGL